MIAPAPLCAAADADTVLVQQTYWGFDGTVVPRTFLPVSFLVQNVSPATVTVRLQLDRLVGFDKPIGTVLEQEITLSGESARWVQFVPFIVDANESWTLSWGPGKKQRMELPQANLGRRATVLVFSRDDVTPPGGVLRRMPEELFPTSVTAMDGLRGVILNKPPYWQGGRARAFLEWLGSGGRVYVLYGPDGKFPEFPAPLEVLNRSDDEFRIGQGTVKRIARKVDDIDLGFARAELFNDSATGGSFWTQLNTGDARFPRSGITWNRDYRIESDLVSLARFRRNWWLIYLLALGYLLSLWPGCYRIGRGLGDYRWYYVAFFFSVVVFSILFIGLGNVGASVRNRVRSVAVARHLHDGIYDVMQWNTVAAARGGDYSLRYLGAGTSFTNSNEFEAVLGSFQVGNNPQANFTIPPAGTRTFQMRNRLSSSRPIPQVQQIAADGSRLVDLDVLTEGTFSGTPSAALALFRDSAYELKVDGGRLYLPARSLTQVPLSQIFDETMYRLDNSFFFTSRNSNGETDSRPVAEIYRDTFLPLLAESLGLDESRSFGNVDLDPNFVRLVVFAEMPPEFFPDGKIFPDQEGRVLYTYDIPVGAGF